MERIHSFGNYANLKHFISEIRKLNVGNEAVFNQSLREFWEQHSGEFNAELVQFTNEVFEHAFFVNAFAEYGINANTGFFSELTAKIKHKILPLNLPDGELGHFIQYLFEDPDDYTWLAKIDAANWVIIIESIGALDEILKTKIQEQICNALTILGNRLTTLGIDPSLSSKFPTIDDLGSPFFNLNYQLDIAIAESSKHTFKEIDVAQNDAIRKSIAEIEALFISIQTEIKEHGTSLNLIFILKRAQQHIERIKLLAHILFSKNKSENISLVAHLIVDMVRAEKLKNSTRQFFKTHTQLLAFRIVSHTSKKGENYIGYSKEENQHLFRAAINGGFVVVVLVFIKHLIHQLHLSLFFEGFLFGLNYGLGFVLMHLLNFTLATKQPALTATFIAESIENEEDRTSKSRIVFKQIIRSQFISLLGNLMVVIPLCFLVSFLFYKYGHIKIYNDTRAHSILLSNHLFYSLCLFYAAITGVFLSISGIVIGYIDNKVAYSEIGIRIEKHPRIIQRYPPEKRKRIAAFIEKNLGAIIGNLFLGFSLGLAGNMGEFIGIPFDIRHITISAGNFSMALLNFHKQDWELLLTVFLSIIFIGLINIVVSFLISFILACSSRGLSWKQAMKLIFIKK